MITSDLGEVGDARAAATGVVGLYLRMAIFYSVLFLSCPADQAGAPNRSMGLLPAASVTIARLVALRWP